MQRINLAEKMELIESYWTPHIVGELNGQHVKLAKVKGEFDWHQHDDEDEMFLVLQGRLRLEFRDRVVDLASGEMAIVPRGIEHRPVADGEAHILLFEPVGTLNTGNKRTRRTVDEPERI